MVVVHRGKDAAISLRFDSDRALGRSRVGGSRTRVCHKRLTAAASRGDHASDDLARQRPRPSRQRHAKRMCRAGPIQFPNINARLVQFPSISPRPVQFPSYKARLVQFTHKQCPSNRAWLFQHPSNSLGQFNSSSGAWLVQFPSDSIGSSIPEQ
ncbi:hypothetical protein GW17_00050355 [Ensete ventricosum]|nr:hypothetical protein GW17_00050355 [Ensete ventricosum]